jgi:fumarate reductase subunit D
MTPRFATRGTRAHASYWAFLVHRISGLALAIFLPLHFWALSRALHGAAALDTFLHAVDRPLFKLGEWLLMLLLALHAAGGVRLLLIEFRDWSGLRKDLIAAAAGFGVLASLAFALALFY